MVQTTVAREPRQPAKEKALVLWFEEVGIGDIPLVGGKNASLGEMIQQLTPKGVNVPTGFATTAYAYRYFIEKADLQGKLRQLFSDLDVPGYEQPAATWQTSSRFNSQYAISDRTRTSYHEGLHQVMRSL